EEEGLRHGRSLPLQLAGRQFFLRRVASLVDGSRAGQPRGALYEHDALAGGVADLFAVGAEVLDAFQHQLFAGALDLVRGAGAVAIAEIEDVAVHFPGAGAVRDAGLFAVDRDREREAATTARSEHQRATLHEQMLAAAGASADVGRPAPKPGWEARFTIAPSAFYDPGARPVRRRDDVCFQTNQATPATSSATMTASALWNHGVRTSRCSPTFTPTQP